MKANSTGGQGSRRAVEPGDGGGKAFYYNFFNRTLRVLGYIIL